MTPRIAALGEILLRLSTQDKQPLKKADALKVTVAGAEANVLVALSSLGHRTTMISRLPASELGELARRELRGAGVDCSNLGDGHGRMGLYYLVPGAGLRASAILYDRKDSAFARSGPDDYDWDQCLAGVTHLHLSGVTPALGPRSTTLATRAAQEALRRDITVIFDGNYRASLWQDWDGNPREILSRLVAEADIFFGNHRDISLLLGEEFRGDGPARRREAALAAFTAFPNLSLIASTARHVVNADHNLIAARADTPTEACQTAEIAVTGIIDRIGAGDAFAAGIIHGVLSGHGLAETVESGLALTCLKHSIPGDFSLFSSEDLDSFDIHSVDVRR